LQQYDWASCPKREATVCLAAVLQGLFEGEGLWEQLYQSE